MCFFLCVWVVVHVYMCKYCLLGDYVKVLCVKMSVNVVFIIFVFLCFFVQCSEFN